MKYALFFLTTLFALAGCGEDAGEAQAKFRVINVSPDSGAIDAFFDESLFFDRVRYPTATEYSEVEADSHDFKLTLNNSFTTFYDATRNLAEDQEYTHFLFDFTENAIGVFVRDDNNRPGSDLVKLRFVHGAPSLDDVDLYITDRNESLADMTPTFENVKFREIPDYVESVEGIYHIRATLRGTKTVVADSGLLSLEAGRIMTILLIDSTGGGEPFQFAVIVDA